MRLPPRLRTCTPLSPRVCADGGRCQRPQHEADRRADVEDRATREQRRAELAEHAAAAADARAREADHKLAVTRQAMVVAEASAAEQGQQLLQALHTSRAEAARLRVQLQQAKRAAAAPVQQPVAPILDRGAGGTNGAGGTGGARGTSGAGARAAQQGSHVRLQSERQAHELAQLTKRMRHRALLHVVRLFVHLPARGRFAVGRAFERWRARPRAARVAVRTSGVDRRQEPIEATPQPQLCDELHHTRALQQGHQIVGLLLPQPTPNTEDTWSPLTEAEPCLWGP